MSKYVIKNCPAFMKPSYCKDKCSYSITNKRDGELTYKFEFDENSKCQDCTDCIIKQIVEECKQRIQFCENCHKTADIAIDCIECDERGEANMSRCILQLLDIQEVE